MANGMTDVPLSPYNEELLDCLAQFIKYNTYLVHMDVSNCGLIEPAIKYLAAFLTKSQALQCLHLDQNEGINEKVIRWICKRINGRMQGREVNIPPMNAEF